MNALMDEAAVEARTKLVLLDALNLQLQMGQRAVEHGAGNMSRRVRRPIAFAGETTGKDDCRLPRRLPQPRMMSG